MSNRKATWLAWSAVALAFVFNLLGITALMASGALTAAVHWTDLVSPFADLTYSMLGALIATRQPRNPIAWIFCAMGLPSALRTFGFGLVSVIVHSSPAWLGALEPAIWLFGSLWIVPFGLIAVLLLLFPNGRLISPRWRVLVWLNGAVIVMGLLTSSGDFEIGTQTLHLNGPAVLLGPDFQEAAQGITMLLLAVSFVLSAVAIMLRWRRARAEERQQLKWFAFASTCFALILLAEIIAQATGLMQVIDPQARFAGDMFQGIPFSLALIALPVAAGIAILKYRLYEIDVIIRRTLIYGVLTAALAFTYFGTVVVLQGLFAAVGGQRSEVITVVSTLVIAALFVPLRRRIQKTIDRRFYRRKYDAAQVLADFAATARDEVDLQRLTEGLLYVVDETMQPAQVGLWLRKP